MTPSDQLSATAETLLQAARLFHEFHEELAHVVAETEGLPEDERAAARDAFADAWSPLVDPLLVEIDRRLAAASAA